MAMSNYYYNGTIEIDNDKMYAEVEVRAEAHGYYIEGDRWGYGCEPPDGDFEIDEVEYLSAKTYDEDGNASDIEITDEIKELVKSALQRVEFTEREFEPDYYEG